MQLVPCALTKEATHPRDYALCAAAGSLRCLRPGALQVTEPLQRTLAALDGFLRARSDDVPSPDELQDAAPGPSIPARKPSMCAHLRTAHWPGPPQQRMSSPRTRPAQQLLHGVVTSDRDCLKGAQHGIAPAEL